MRNIAFALAGAGLLAIGTIQSASAADIPARVVKAPAMVAPVFSWTGFYIGLNAGYGWGHDDIRLGGDPSTIAGIAGGVLPSSIAGNPDGFVGGGQIGYNYQTGAWLVGFEADIQWANVKTNQTIFLAPGGGLPPFATSASQELEWFGTARARLGFVPAPAWLLYATGGLAYGSVELTARSALSHPTLPPCFLTFCGAGSTSSVRVGWTAGAGVEYAVSPSLSLKAEYLYYDLGTATLTLTDLLNRPGGVFQSYSVDVTGSIVRGGLNYRLGG